jgi:hypothetical protein
MDSKIYDIPTHCKAGVVVNEGPDFQVKVEMVPVPEPGVSLVHIEDNETDRQAPTTSSSASMSPASAPPTST